LHATVPQEPSGNSQRPKTILVVEDEILVRLMVADELRTEGFVVLEAINAEEALVVLQGPEPIDLLLTDVRMPGAGDGLTLAATVRALWPELKIIVVSGHLPGGPSPAIADGFFVKPFDVPRLVNRVKELLGIAP
jgi:CheY-like chemotaxis protein